MQCPKCGTESPSQARFCRNCGANLAAETQAPSPTSQVVSPEQRAQRLLEEAFRQAEQGRTLAAIQTCQQAIAINPRSTSAHSLLGTLFERQGDREKAIREYEQVLSLSPESTVERRRLNELMGVPAAREGVSVSPRVARLALTGAAGVVILVVAIAVVFTAARTPREQSVSTPLTRRVTSGSPGMVASDQSAFLSPGQMYLGRVAAPPPVPALSGARQVVSMPSEPMVRQVSVPVSSYQATGADRYYSTGRVAATAPVPMAGAVAYRGGVPVVSAPTTTTTVRWPVNTQTGRAYYMQGDYQRSVEAYRSYIDQNPTAGGAPREELAWVYTQMGDRQQATQQYRNAINHYQVDVERGHNVEAARHGLRTCEAAIRALEAR